MPDTFAAIRDRLPTLYRPDDADPGAAASPLAPADVVAVRGAPPGPPLEVVLRPGRSGVIVELPVPARIGEIRLARGRAPGTGYSLEIYRIDADVPERVAAAAAGVRNSRARFTTSPAAPAVLVRLRRKTLLSLLITAASDGLDALEEETGDVLNAHWFETADLATFHPHFLLARMRAGLGPVDFADPDDRLAVATFPYVRDLGRMGSLLDLSPWTEPAPVREVVEAYRTRIARTVAMYRDGLGTVTALRRVVEISLPVDQSAPPESRDRPFTIEEFAPVAARRAEAATAGPPDGIVGPLMRFALVNDGLAGAAVTAYVSGIDAVEGETAATVAPVLERFADRIAIAYDGTVAPGATLRLRPAHDSWLGGPGGLRRARSSPGSAPADPTAAGPWAEVAGAPPGAVSALARSSDHFLWAAVDDGSGGSSLWRFDGSAFAEALPGLPRVLCLEPDGNDLLVGTESGVTRALLHGGGGPVLSPPAAALAGPRVAALLAFEGRWLAATPAGITAIGPDGGLEPFGLADTEVDALAADGAGTLHAGTAHGAFQHQPGTGHWYWYAGADAGEGALDWRRFHPDESGDARNFPAEGDVFLPRVTALRRGPDAALWLGTERGLARYRARPAGRGTLAYTTVLEAFPDLGEGRVNAIAHDERGVLWFATARGLVRFDGRDLWQHRDGDWVRLGRPDLLYEDGAEPRPRGSWRFDRSSEAWQRSEPSEQAGAWIPFTGALRTTAEAEVSVLLWTDSVVADVVTGFDPETLSFEASEAAPGALRMRFKPDDTRIVDGGIPAVPRLPAGESTWRYLSLEPAAVSEPARAPVWTIEGRLLPPPPDAPAAGEGRFDTAAPPPRRSLDESVFAYEPAARVAFGWDARRPLSVLVRLGLLSPDERLEPVVVERVASGAGRVRPAGVTTRVAIAEDIYQGGGSG